MPTYHHSCKFCKAHCEIEYPMKYVGKEEELPFTTLNKITCNINTCKDKEKCKSGEFTFTLMPRIPFAPHIANQSGGTTVSEKTLLKKKQESLKQRAIAHTANEGYKTIKDPEMKAHIKKKYKGFKGGDHERMKPK